ncbi:IclR family transcriptional regulator C-terminal domain-containing protein [Citricoccus muralis]|uniref:IclR family transcriptional regulator C-terminal domain-containing protein n=1 Tax=Citricoccus muralis TaxID=169134 RepID=A0ABY8H4R9_9MICC|nr:IclR family transcriptional regulator C-terminal domain-containing protein [Citricoccus muralis]WFP15926.1 IclR family transcriptional regulator C-terminal domain-containing protein [Citricoccus muralis]
MESTRALRASPRVGVRMSDHATAGGKIQVAHLDQKELIDLFPVGLKPLTSHTETDLQALFKELKRCRDRGYALSREESTEGISAISVPIQNSHQRTVAALSVVAPSSRLPHTRFNPMIRMLAEVAATVRSSI